MKQTIENKLEPKVCSLKRSIKLTYKYNDQEKIFKLVKSGIKGDSTTPTISYLIEIKIIVREYY